MALSIDLPFKKKTKPKNPFNFFLFYTASIPSTPSIQLCTLAVYTQDLKHTVFMVT